MNELQPPIQINIPKETRDGYFESAPTKVGNLIQFRGFDGLPTPMRVKSVSPEGDDGWNIELEPIA